MAQRADSIAVMTCGLLVCCLSQPLEWQKANDSDLKRYRFHDLRHTFATRLVQAGADIYTVQKLRRWKTISMVMRYAHHHPESLRAGIEILDRVPAGVSTVLAQSAGLNP
jgi:hypothetical protein